MEGLPRYWGFAVRYVPAGNGPGIDSIHSTVLGQPDGSHICMTRAILFPQALLCLKKISININNK